MDQSVALQEFEQINNLRAQVYRMLGSLYFTELSMDQIRSLSEQDYRVFADLDPELAQGAQEMERALRHPHSGLREDLAVDYAHIFLAAGSTKDEERGVPYESVYTSEERLLMGPARQAVYRVMLKEGVLPDESLHVPEDHLSFECEFMAHMAAKSVDALKADDVAEARRCVEVQQNFRTEHLANWIGDLCAAVVKSGRTRFYRGVALVTKAFVRIDEELLGECAAVLDGGQGSQGDTE
ncbi:molecular chaperone TorD family protein [Adlercreutzia equolifaciens]|uniref:TorD/DmsD family molecular chaperone n=1 Tax=Adlercreutzia equolifaciens TaxID=446660 RepID=UPI0023B1306F|nr:molecular chaperone TorD family protein [Adlercreutzia equolifaciens]MDE8702114.1 molecular chaperone TorD family protein [Adlercreutzia equolifaciens]